MPTLSARWSVKGNNTKREIDTWGRKNGARGGKDLGLHFSRLIGLFFCFLALFSCPCTFSFSPHGIRLKVHPNRTQYANGPKHGPRHRTLHARETGPSHPEGVPVFQFLHGIGPSPLPGRDISAQTGAALRGAPPKPRKPEPQCMHNLLASLIIFFFFLFFLQTRPWGRHGTPRWWGGKE